VTDDNDDDDGGGGGGDDDDEYLVTSIRKDKQVYRGITGDG